MMRLMERMRIPCWLPRKPESKEDIGQGLKLMRIENIEERHFYEIEAVKNNWSLRELNRQFDAALYERLALSTNKKNITISQSGTDCRKVLGHCERSLCVEIFRIGRKKQVLRK